MTSNEVIRLEGKLETLGKVLENIQTNMLALLDCRKLDDERIRILESKLAITANDLKWVKELKIPLYVSGGGSALVGLIYGLVQFFGK